MYYFLECRSLEGEEDVLISEWPRQPDIDSWMTGLRFGVPVEEPVVCRLHPDHRGQLLPLFNDEILLIRHDLFDLLQSAGVDNMDAYRAHIAAPTGEVVSEDYLAVNVIGLVAAADMEESQWRNSSGESLVSVDFDAVVLRPDIPADLKMFRLAECVTGLLVRADVRKAIQDSGRFRNVLFIPPEEWVG